MTSRTPMADLLKGIAVVLMIQVHILENFASNSVFNSHGGKSTQIEQEMYRLEIQVEEREEF